MFGQQQMHGVKCATKYDDADDTELFREDLACNSLRAIIHGPYMWNFVKCPVQKQRHTRVASAHKMEYSTYVTNAFQDPKPTRRSSHLKDKSVQTDYRESEAQTDPYSPTYKIAGRTQPEVLTLTSLAWGRGLPAGQEEISMIERARAKRRLESFLPPLNRENLAQRLTMLARIECHEWIHREKQIDDLQRIRMGVFKKMLQEQNESYRAIADERIEIVTKNKQKHLTNYLSALYIKHFLEMRKIMLKKQRAHKKQLSAFTSEEPVSLLRSGRLPVQCTQAQRIRCKYLESYSDLKAFEQSLPQSNFNLKLKLPKLTLLPKTGYVKRKFKLQKKLEEAYEAIEVAKAQKKISSSSSSLMEKLEKPPPRPVTPEIRDAPESEDQRLMATVCLQKILRGRAVHIMMKDGKERREDLIQELRTASALYDADQLDINFARQELKNELCHRAAIKDQNDDVEEIVETAAGGEISLLLDFLNKELIRLHDERKVHAMSLLAERQRRLREAQESGLRQVEERRRQEEDEIFRQMLKIHEKSTDVYLEDVLTNSVHQAARTQATKEIAALAQKISDAAYEYESRKNEIESEEIVAELVHSFLLPEVQKKMARNNVVKKQQAALSAAYDIIYAELSRPLSVSEAASPEHGGSSEDEDARSVAESVEPNWHNDQSLETWTAPADRFAASWCTHPDDVSTSSDSALPPAPVEKTGKPEAKEAPFLVEPTISETEVDSDVPETSDSAPSISGLEFHKM